MEAAVGTALARRIREISLALYARAAAHALARGVVIADTKFEFGLDEHGELVLMDEVLTPDSSRFWPLAAYAEGRNPPSLDKQPLRDWLEARAARLGPDSWPDAQDASLHETLGALQRGYLDVLARLTG
jgi:phosphoribosylaminoimidazole-succinocarboxamide synthase